MFPPDYDMNQNMKAKLTPFIVSGVIIIADQISKIIIVNTISLHTIGFSLFNGFLRIVHTRNLGIAFSLGIGLPEGVRSILFTFLPVIILVVLIFYYSKSNELSAWERWSIAIVFGGGIGNLIDRVFRPLGVVDFIDVKFFGIFGLQRWPTFNIADASVVIGGIILIVSILFHKEGDIHHE